MPSTAAWVLLAIALVVAWAWFVRRPEVCQRAREAIGHLRAGGVVGIFPEGGIERPPRQVRPFLAGVGLFIKKTKARVLPVVIQGTPVVDPAWASLKHFSHSQVDVKPMIDYSE